MKGDRVACVPALVCAWRHDATALLYRSGNALVTGKCITLAPACPAPAYARCNQLETVDMKSINELLELFMRQAQLERAMKQPGGARVVEERELHALRRKIAVVPDALKRDLGA
jgi:hypothetical protein